MLRLSPFTIPVPPLKEQVRILRIAFQPLVEQFNRTAVILLLSFLLGLTDIVPRSQLFLLFPFLHGLSLRLVQSVHNRVRPQFPPLFVVNLDSLGQTILHPLLCGGGDNRLSVAGFADGEHQIVKAADFHQIALLVLHQLQNPVVRQFSPVAPVDAVGHFCLDLFQKAHQALIAAAVADDNGRVNAEQPLQSLLPLGVELGGVILRIQRGEEQPSVNLCNNGPLDIGLNKPGQRLVADHQRLFVGVEEECILHEGVKVCGDNQIVPKVLLCQQQRKGLIAHTGVDILHDALHIAVAEGGVGVEAQSVDVKVVFAVNAGVVSLGLLPRLFNLLKGVAEQLVLLKDFSAPAGFLRIHFEGAPVIGFPHDTVHPPHLQLIAGGNSGFHGRTGTEDEAEASFVAIRFRHLTEQDRSAQDSGWREAIFGHICSHPFSLFHHFTTSDSLGQASA